MKIKFAPVTTTLLCGVFFIFSPLANANADTLPVRVMAANITSGNGQSYEAPGIRIFQGLKPDIVMAQEFRYNSSSSPGQLRALVDEAFGTNYSFFVEPTGNIPNGIVSRYPILAAGSWTDTQVSDRGFAWAQIDLPGSNDLYVVSIHLLTSGAGVRNTEATNLKALIQANFPANAWIIVGGDCNADSRTEAALDTFATFLSDAAVPTDGRTIAQNGDKTNAGRTKPYDYVLPSFSLTNYLTAVSLPSSNFPSGLVFDSGRYANLSDVAPVQATDSSAVNMQHMAVIKDFLLPFAGSNGPSAPSIVAQPQSQTNSPGDTVTFTVSANGTAPLAYQWRFFGTNASGATNAGYSITNVQTANAGDYTVVITNASGSVTSSIAKLTISTSVLISSQPQSQTVTVGANATFTVGVSGAAPFAYQWRFNTAPINNATNSSFTRTNAQLPDAGNYTVVITNASSSLTSSIAVLTVNTQAIGVTATNVVISQIYGGGGNTSASYRNDFIELFNPTPNAINLTGWSVQYASATGTAWQVGTLNGSIQPYKYYLVQLASSAAVGSFIPTAEATNGINISASQGKVALANSQTALTGSSPIGSASLVDFVGFGSANAFEGSATAPGAPSGNNTTSILRKDGGLTDSNNNSNDFTTTSPPIPRNSSAPANPPTPQSNPAATPALTNAALLGSQFQFVLTGTAGSNYIVQATSNLSISNWISLRTNAAPFTFVESNVFALPQRFYRGLAAP